MTKIELYRETLNHQYEVVMGQFVWSINKRVRLGDVLQRIPNRELDPSITQDKVNLILLWGKCGKSKSLQTIAEEDTKEGNKLISSLYELFVNK